MHSSKSNVKMEEDQILSNLKIAEKLEIENNGQFLTLCKMHLSFEIDLELENNEPGTEKLKSKLWSRLQRRTGKCAFPTSDSTPITTQSRINQIKKLVVFLEKEENITQEGIFRKTGSLTRQQTLLKKLMDDVNTSIDESSYTAHDCASVLKTVLAEFDEPVISLNYFFAFQQVADIYNSKLDCKIQENRLLNSLQLLMLLIPKENRTLLKLIVQILNKTIKHEKINKMTADSLSTLFTPHLVCPRKLNSEALYKVAKTMYSVVSFIIKTGETIFYIPEKLATDIRAYFAEKIRRKTITPEHILNESVASETETTASTVFTFIDREKTAKAHDTETTDTALANLYAYIVSLPESSRKKKLIHKFNKENGKGTPLQFLNGQRDKNSTSLLAKTLGSSIKKHIFQKNFLSKTPKRSGTPSSQTPNKTVKVLFSNTPCSSREVNSESIMHNQASNIEPASSKAFNESLTHELNLTQKMSMRSISDSHLNKNFESTFETPSKERSASVGDIHNLSNDEVSNNMFVSELNDTVFNRAESNDVSDNDDDKDQFNCMSSLSQSINNEFDEINSSPAIYSVTRRQSMSPITKSTKRMPKSMQEQIMTPRSRKPITAVESLSSENKSNVFGSLLEESEVENVNVHEEYTNYIGVPNSAVSSHIKETVSNTFKEYLLNRSVVITEIPNDIPDDDTSFTSHPDDFIDDLKDLSESQMSETMLFCLDGNDPMSVEEMSSRKRAIDNIKDDNILKEPNSKRLYIGETSL